MLHILVLVLKNKIMKQWLIWVGGALLLCIIIIQIDSSSREDSSNESQVELFYSLQDTIRYLRNRDGSNTAQIKLLEADKRSLGKVLAAKDKRLSELLKKGSTSSTVFETVTVHDTVTKVRIDTVNSKPAFKEVSDNGWVRLDLELRDDSLRKSIIIKDSISVSFKKVPNGFLRRKKSVVEVTNHNPYVRVNNLRSFSVEERKANKLFWVGVGLAGGIILFK